MKKYLFALLLLVFVLPACKDDTANPTPEKEPEFSDGVAGIDLTGFWQVCEKPYNDNSEPKSISFLNIVDISEDNYSITYGIGRQDTIEWETKQLMKSDEISFTEDYSATKYLNIMGYLSCQSQEFLWGKKSSGEGSYAVVFQKNNNPGMIAYLGIFGVQENNTLNENKLEHKFGTGQPIVFIHGFLGEAKGWNEMLDSLENNNYGDDFSVYTYEYDYDLSMPEIVDLMKSDFASEFTDEEPVLVGHSMGGVVSRAFILNGGGFKDFISLGAPLGGVYLYDAPINKLLLDMLFTDGTMDLLLGSDYMNELNSIDESEYAGRYFLLSSKMEGEWDTLNFKLYGEPFPWKCWQWKTDYSGDFALLNVALRNVMTEKGLPTENDGFISNYSSNMLWKYDESQLNTPGYPKKIDLGMTAAHDKMTKPHRCPEFLDWLLNDYRELHTAE